MEPESAPAKRRSNGHFSFFALIGSVFAGLWACGIVLILFEVFSSSSLSKLSRLPLDVAGSVFWSVWGALIWTIPASVAVGGLVFLLARIGRDRSLPSGFGFVGFGFTMGATIVLMLLVCDFILGGSMPFADSIALATAGLVGGAIAGITYRRLIVYRNLGSGYA
ncbi:hypothetical protein IG197_24555 [Aminobacter sp. SR38]|jgi:hypothetical protein|uniref:hypothetical protein n=1 Tax=Aminobacter sp. SR38 TaxID=2774562 RepID=UPI0017833E14|nr:hypothetical protein [Aminobacter sp. SR38]QOF70924.1 hypothetical protein IG197_24555 [Aminobacter sp. SR38]